jgi:SAM-dependent methyltransferase
MLESMNRAARFFDTDYAGYDEDIPVLEAFAQRTGGPLLELGCGTGRAIIPLAKRGHRVTGVDISPEMLRIAAVKARAARVRKRVTLIEGNYVDAPLEGPYAFAFVLMNTFMHLVTQEDQLRALQHWREHLAPGGLLLIDVFHPDVGVLANLDGRLIHDRTWTDPETGRTVMKWVVTTVELAHQLLHVTLIFEELGTDGSVQRTLVPYDVRYLWRYEAELLLKMAGFDLETIFGDWDLSPFRSDSDRMLLLARRRE